VYGRKTHKHTHTTPHHTTTNTTRKQKQKPQLFNTYHEKRPVGRIDFARAWQTGDRLCGNALCPGGQLNHAVLLVIGLLRPGPGAPAHRDHDCDQDQDEETEVGLEASYTHTQEDLHTHRNAEENGTERENGDPNQHDEVGLVVRPRVGLAVVVRRHKAEHRLRLDLYTREGEGGAKKRECIASSSGRVKQKLDSTGIQMEIRSSTADQR
jgi:hypothetical protein